MKGIGKATITVSGFAFVAANAAAGLTFTIDAGGSFALNNSNDLVFTSSGISNTGGSDFTSVTATFDGSSPWDWSSGAYVLSGPDGTVQGTFSGVDAYDAFGAINYQVDYSQDSADVTLNGTSGIYSGWSGDGGTAGGTIAYSGSGPYGGNLQIGGTIAAVPEPFTMGLIAAGLGFAASRRRRSK
jgi:hypothetical protein